jgi:hypothetical protein
VSDQNRNYFTETPNKVILNAFKCEIYVPEYYFEVKLAVQDGELFDLFFIAKYRIIHNDTDDIAKLPIYDFRIPTMVLTRPDEVQKAEFDLYGIKERFSVFTYYKGGEIIFNRGIVKNSTSVERYINLLNDGKIRVPYAKVNDTTNKVQKIHDVKLNVPQYIQQLVISDVYRDKDNYAKPARLVATDTDSNNDGLKGLSMRENAAFTSTIAGVGFEDVKSMLTVADNRDDKNVKTFSTIEKVIRGIRDNIK